MDTTPTTDGKPVPAQLTDGARTRAFLLGGNARVTLVSTKTGTRFTFRVRTKDTPKKDAAAVAPWFVALLTGPENTTDYTFLGTIFEDKTYRHGRKSRVAPEAPSAKGFAWAWSFIARGELPPGCEVWHEGRCGRCGHPLTDPASIAMGLGPVCAEGGF
jgi:uncharacterized protein DUF6011